MKITMINSEIIPYESLPFGFSILIKTLKKNLIEPEIIDYNYLKKIGPVNILFSLEDINNYLFYDKITT
ncbi:MAG: hypothetical protein KKC26_02845, partial [Nanoarchaeota archaeon]|nr:hypothetical protein [Nanoarchaeota archaeon]